MIDRRRLMMTAAASAALGGFATRVMAQQMPVLEPAPAEPGRLAAASNGLLFMLSFRTTQVARDLPSLYIRAGEAARTGG